MSERPFVLIVVFDGLRRDLIDAAVMPTLSSFLNEGCDFPESSCVFPSATRVNATSLATGAYPARHGVVSNKFYAPDVAGGRMIHTGLFEDIMAAEAACGGHFVTSPTLGDVMAEAGLSLAVVSSGSAGTTHMTNPRAEKNRQPMICLSDWRRSSPPDLADRMLTRFGPIAPVGKPNSARMVQQTQIFIEGIYPECKPDAAILWYNDPDLTFHHRGLGSPDAISALAALDQEFALLLDWAASDAPGRPVDIIVASDHGHITARETVSVPAALGVETTSDLAEQGIVGSLGYVGGLRRQGEEREGLEKVAATLADQFWCGLQFSEDAGKGKGEIASTLSRRLVFNDHARSPQLFYLMRSDDQPNVAGISGSCYFASDDVPIGGSVHSGLHRKEMNNLLAMRGPSFGQGKRYIHGAGIVDITPTALALLGLKPAPEMQGRVLREALRGGTMPTQAGSEEFAIDAACGPVRLRHLIVEGTRYLHSAMIGPGA